MPDVRSMLKNERAARRVQHKHASYSTSGTLLCTVCHLQLKSESLWEGHLRSAGHIMRAQKLLETGEQPISEEATRKKRKASDEDDNIDTIRKRTKPSNPSLPEGFFDLGQEVADASPKVSTPTNDIQIPSRPATPLKPAPQTAPPSVVENVDEAEWAAFEADIALAEDKPELVKLHSTEGVISAPAMTAAELKLREAEEDYKHKKDRLEAEAEGDKEDAARKLEEEFEAMESLEQRVKRLRERREALRVASTDPPPLPVAQANSLDDDQDEDEDEEDVLDDFMMKS